jgi:hypothetical protein
MHLILKYTDYDLVSLPKQTFSIILFYFILFIYFSLSVEIHSYRENYACFTELKFGR